MVLGLKKVLNTFFFGKPYQLGERGRDTFFDFHIGRLQLDGADNICTLHRTHMAFQFIRIEGIDAGL